MYQEITDLIDKYLIKGFIRFDVFPLRFHSFQKSYICVYFKVIAIRSNLNSLFDNIYRTFPIFLGQTPTEVFYHCSTTQRACFCPIVRPPECISLNNSSIEDSHLLRKTLLSCSFQMSVILYRCELNVLFTKFESEYLHNKERTLNAIFWLLFIHDTSYI